MIFKIKLLKNDKFFLSTGLNFLSRGAIIGLNLLLIPLLLKVLGTEKFGIWQTVLSLISLISLLNFGLGNGLRNLITKLSSNKRTEEIGPAVGATIKTTSKIILIALLILIPLLVIFFNPHNFFAQNNISVSEIKSSVLIFAIFFLINIILGLSNSIAYGFQKSHYTGFFQFIYLLLCYVFIFILRIYKKIDLIDVSLIFGGFQSLCFLVLLIFQVKKFNLKISYKDYYPLKETYKLSGNFFFVQILALIFLSIDNFVISSVLGATETADFSIVNRLFFTLIGVFSILLIQFWNSVTEAKEKNKIDWIKKTLKLLFIAAVITFLISLVISYFQSKILLLWLGKNFNPIASSTFYLFSLYTFTHCLNAILINLQNGLGELKIQILSISAALFIYIFGLAILDIHKYGYNSLIILKILGTVVAIVINSYVMRKIYIK